MESVRVRWACEPAPSSTRSRFGPSCGTVHRRSVARWRKTLAPPLAVGRIVIWRQRQRLRCAVVLAMYSTARTGARLPLGLRFPSFARQAAHPAPDPKRRPSMLASHGAEAQTAGESSPPPKPRLARPAVCEHAGPERCREENGGQHLRSRGGRRSSAWLSRSKTRAAHALGLRGRRERCGSA
jgi:hypothetical protein